MDTDYVKKTFNCFFFTDSKVPLLKDVDFIRGGTHPVYNINVAINTFIHNSNRTLPGTENTVSEANYSHIHTLTSYYTRNK